MLLNKMDRIEFKVNDILQSVNSCEVDSNLMLVDFLRDCLELRGTKYMCREGGCGACIVSVVKFPGGPTLSCNSCMVSITSCHNWEITTIEGLGNRQKGYHPLQKSLADHNGSQCGYCSPAWVMNMFSILTKTIQSTGKKPTMLEIEKSFGGNVCRCTGYRPILEAFKVFARDYTNNDLIKDIEDLTLCSKSGSLCKKTKCDDDWCILNAEDTNIIKINLKDNRVWYKVCEINSIFQILNQTGYDSYMLVVGNTAKGAYPISEYPCTLIDISSVTELQVVELDQNLIVGAGLTLTELLEIFEVKAKEQYFQYLKKLADHIRQVAHIPIRNVGSVGGNLMIKHLHNEFPSDIFLLYETVGAYLTLVDSKGALTKVTMEQFLKQNMKGKVIVNALLPPLSDEFEFFSYKVMPRAQNAHAIVNAGFLYKLSSNRVIEARIVFGGLSPVFNRAENTERYLVGKLLFSNTVIQAALRILQKELIVTENPPEPSVEYRTHLALSLFYKNLINLCPKNILNKRYECEGSNIHETRPVSNARQVFDTNPTLWPLNQPIPKIEGLVQCAGEATYSDDLPVQPREVHAAFVLTTVALGHIDNIDPSYALSQPGVLAFYTAKDIPGLNSFTPAGTTFYVSNEEILCSGTVQYFDQPYGIIVAETQHIAEAAAKLVKATYKNTRVPAIDIKDTKNDPARLTLNATNPSTDRGLDVTKVISGSNTIYGQYHFMLENIACVTRPTEEGIEVFSTTQWMDGVQVMISKALNIEENRIDVHVRRLGGAYGMKISRPSQVAISCSLVTQKLNRPCRLVVPLTTTTRAIGKRYSCHSEFVCEVNDSGTIQHIEYKVYEDNGYKVNETLTMLGTGVYNNCYNGARWNYSCYDVTTDKAKNTWCRSPGSFESISMSEYVLERISYELDLDPFNVRMANLDTTKYNDLKEMAENLRETASYVKRRASVDRFNANNRWRKRGLRFSFLRWTPVGGSTFEVNISVFHGDGTVIITHGGIEMGQGIGSIGSLNVGLAVWRGCEQLCARLEPIRIQLNNPTWEELIANAFKQNIDLQAHGFVNMNDVFMYDIFGVALAEVEIDILTGEWECCRLDLLQDAGQSVSPEVDIGQVEGAFIMGMGYWSSECLEYNKNTGELLTDRTWNYYVPLALDIPQDFRVYLRKKSYSVEQILGAKATGESPLCLSIVIAFAMREAIAEARKDSGIPMTKWFQIDGLYTTKRIALASASKIEDFKLI